MLHFEHYRFTKDFSLLLLSLAWMNKKMDNKIKLQMIPNNEKKWKMECKNQLMELGIKLGHLKTKYNLRAERVF